MNVEIVTLDAQPMLYLTRMTTIDSEAIGRAMGEAFDTLGAFIGSRQVPVAGPPLAIYRDYADGNVTMDIGFPVPAAASALAADEVKAGMTPGGKAARAIHMGRYDMVGNAHDALGAYFKKLGHPIPTRSWEVYLNEPGKVPDAELKTEVYMPVDG